MKLRGGILLVRIELEKEKDLTDPEWRLWLEYRLLCVWDRKKADFGTANLTIRELRKYLNWSVGKICETQKSLVAKGKLEKIGKSKYRIVGSEYLLARSFREVEIGVRRIESAVRYVEKKRGSGGTAHQQKGFEIPAFSSEHFQPTEFGKYPKETIKKNKETNTVLKKEAEIPTWRDPLKVESFLERSKKNNNGP